MSDATAGDTRCGFVALIGAPNVGKSTFINQIVGAKVSIVSRKVQTTRALVRGITMNGSSQMIFVDTPGIFAPKRRLDRAMVATAWRGAGDADVSVLLVDARKGHDKELAAIFENLPRINGPKVLVLNKIDAIRPEATLALTEALNREGLFADTFMISALNGDGVPEVVAALAERMAPGPWLYPADQVSDAPLRLLAAEITREKLFDRLHDELPYQSTVETELWKELDDGAARIEQTIYVTRASHKKIIIGESGRTIKAIGSAARKEIAEAADHPVHLFLFVKVRSNWTDDPERYRMMGLDFSN